MIDIFFMKVEKSKKKKKNGPHTHTHTHKSQQRESGEQDRAFYQKIIWVLRPGDMLVRIVTFHADASVH